MFFAKDFPDKLRSSVLTSEIVGKKVKLQQRGKDFLGLCPFHNEKTPSFTVNDQKGFYHCFGCGAHGDIITFKMEQEGLEFKDAVVNIAEEFGIEVPIVQPSNRPFDSREEDLTQKKYLVLEKICQFFEDNLKGPNGENAKNYLKTRDLNSSRIKKFRLGFSKNSYDDLTNFLKKEGLNENEILATGVIGKGNGGKLYDKFRNRVIFPILDKKSRPIAFGGRTIGDDMPKYLNSAETQFFKKNQTLYNLDKARKAIFDKGAAIVVEGYMDAIAVSINQMENVVAGLGTALGTEHLKELFRITDKIIICLDGDLAGIRAAKRVSTIALPLISAKKNIQFAILPNQMDPDDFINKFGREELENFLENSSPLSESLFEFALMELKIDRNSKISAENKAKIEASLNEKLEAMIDVSSKKYFSFFFKDLLFNLGKKGKKSGNLTEVFSKKRYVAIGGNISDQIAKNIIAFIICKPELIEFEDDIFNVREMNFGSEKFTSIKDLLIELIENNEENLLSALEKSDFSKDIKGIKNILQLLERLEVESFLIKFRILLLKDLSIQVNEQYQDSLKEVGEIETHQSALTDQKIKEIFDYKNFLEKQILSLEKEII